METKSYIWRIWMAVSLTTLGVLYYLVFLYYLAGGVPIEKIHYLMTDGWPNFCADNVPLVAPGFLFLGLYFWYSYNTRSKPKTVVEPTYDFSFTKVEKTPELTREPDYVFESRSVRNAKVNTAVAEPEPVVAATPVPTPAAVKAASAPVVAPTAFAAPAPFVAPTRFVPASKVDE